MVDDADDRGIRRHWRRIKGERSFAASHKEDLLAYASTNRIDADHRAGGWVPINGERLQNEELEPAKIGVLPGCDDRTGDSSKLHASKGVPVHSFQTARVPSTRDTAYTFVISDRSCSEYSGLGLRLVERYCVNDPDNRSIYGCLLKVGRHSS